jgi:hypothetical protein
MPSNTCGISVVRRDYWINILAAVQQNDKIPTEFEGTFLRRRTCVRSA